MLLKNLMVADILPPTPRPRRVNVPWRQNLPGLIFSTTSESMERHNLLHSPSRVGARDSLTAYSMKIGPTGFRTVIEDDEHYLAQPVVAYSVHEMLELFTRECELVMTSTEATRTWRSGPLEKLHKALFGHSQHEKIKRDLFDTIKNGNDEIGLVFVAIRYVKLREELGIHRPGVHRISTQNFLKHLTEIRLKHLGHDFEKLTGVWGSDNIPSSGISKKNYYAKHESPSKHPQQNPEPSQ